MSHYVKNFIYCIILKYFSKYTNKLSKATLNRKISIGQFPHSGKISQNTETAVVENVSLCVRISEYLYHSKQKCFFLPSDLFVSLF